MKTDRQSFFHITINWDWDILTFDTFVKWPTHQENPLLGQMFSNAGENNTVLILKFWNTNPGNWMVCNKNNNCMPIAIITWHFLLVQ